MLLLYPVNEIIQLVSSLFTFHYASTLSQTSASQEGSTPHLHSTMLLLYRIWEAHAVTNYIHLHSTMLLLYRAEKDVQREAVYIYIPLCFYFISAEVQGTNTLRQIYIPLCFYFIVELDGTCGFAIWFTFHYASTLSNSAHGYPESLYRFTFHYASTLSRKMAWLGNWLWHLHSTMLLLYLEPVQIQIQIVVIYIPLCFYFICIPPFYCWYQLLFTFHYASTLSLWSTILNGQGMHLHSTMLLLYLRQRCGACTAKWYLHSTMLLLYRFTGPRSIPVRFNLHSTMLLLYPGSPETKKVWQT